jgi:hypothetical protein
MLKAAPTTILLVTDSSVSGTGHQAGEAPTDVEHLVEQLQARVETRRQAGVYPPGLEKDLSALFERILHQRREHAFPDIDTPLRAVGAALTRPEAFADPVYEALLALAGAVEELKRMIEVDVSQSLDALHGRQTALGRAPEGQ